MRWVWEQKMTKESEQQLPVARHERLLVQNLPDEVLVYDLNRNKAHCLNQTAALIWRRCDGQTSVTELTRLLKDRMQEPVDEEIVWFALDQLGKRNLLVERIARSTGAPRLTRRQLIQRVGLAISVPLVISIIAPTASASVSCENRPCTIVNDPVCGTCSCDVGAGTCV